MKTFDIAYLLYKPEELFFKSVDRILRQNSLPERIWLLLTKDEKWNSNSLLDELKLRSISLDRIRILEIEKDDFGHGKTRNTAAELSDSDYLILMTQDAVPADKKLCGELVNALSTASDKGTVAVAYGRQLARDNADITEKFSRSYNYPTESECRDIYDLEKKGIKAIFCSDACAIYNLEIFRALNGFEDDVEFNEDELYAYKALKNHYAVRYCAEARVFHSHNLSLKEQFRRSCEIAESQKEHPEVFAELATEKEGVKFFKKGLAYIAKRGSLKDCLYFVIYCGVRYLGYKMPAIKKILK